MRNRSQFELRSVGRAIRRLSGQAGAEAVKRRAEERARSDLIDAFRFRLERLSGPPTNGQSATRPSSQRKTLRRPTKTTNGRDRASSLGHYERRAGLRFLTRRPASACGGAINLVCCSYRAEWMPVAWLTRAASDSIAASRGRHPAGADIVVRHICTGRFGVARPIDRLIGSAKSPHSAGARKVQSAGGRPRRAEISAPAKSRLMADSGRQ